MVSVYWIMLIITTAYTGRFGWETWKNGNRAGACGLWALAVGTVIGSFVTDLYK